MYIMSRPNRPEIDHHIHQLKTMEEVTINNKKEGIFK